MVSEVPRRSSFKIQANEHASDANVLVNLYSSSSCIVNHSIRRTSSTHAHMNAKTHKASKVVSDNDVP